MELNLSALQMLQPISLEEMDAVALLNRKDTKFVFPLARLSAVLEQLSDSYRVLTINNKRWTEYDNLYFDTPERYCYYQHHNRRLNRFKFRIREYVGSDLAFFEIKFKSNRERTIKSRMKIPSSVRELTGEIAAFIREKSPFNTEEMEPSISIGFTRITLVSHDLTERATLDIGLEASGNNKMVQFNNIVIAELKQDGIISGSQFKVALRMNNSIEQRISKYCICLSRTEPELKSNLFKPKHLNINKLKKFVANE